MAKYRMDKANNQVTVSLADPQPTILLISGGKVECINMHEFGHFIAKSEHGQIKAWENTEKGRM